MKVLVSGAAGFLGSHLCDALLARGDEVYAIDNLYTGSLDNLEQARQSENFHFGNHDVVDPLDAAAVTKLFGSDIKFDRVYWLACPASPPHYQRDPVYTLRISVWGTYNGLEVARRNGARFLLTSTSEVYGDPEVHPQPESYRGNVNCTGIRSCYDEGKRAAETLVFDYMRFHKLEIRVSRIFNTFGPRMDIGDGRITSNFVVQAVKGEPLTVYGDGSQTRSFCYVSDNIAGQIALMEGPVPGPINIGNPEEHTIGEMANIIRDLAGSESKLVYYPLPSDDPKLRRPVIDLAKKEIGWEPKVSMLDGMRETIKYFREKLARGGGANNEFGKHVLTGELAGPVADAPSASGVSQ